MRIRHLAVLACLLSFAVSHATAQRSEKQRKLGELRDALATLEWQKVDLASLTLVERCRTLLLLNHALDELGDATITEADLLGEFLEQQKLMDAYAAAPPESPPRIRTMEEAQQVAVALLKGPLARSRYATELSETDEPGLQAYEKLYGKTCADKWADFSESARSVRSMAAFLKSNGKIKAYMTWALAETDRRQQEYEQELAARRAAGAAKEKEQKEQAERARAAERERQRAESQTMQEALYAVQDAAPAGEAVEVDDGDDWYAGWYYGVLDNAKRERPAYRDGDYQAKARDRVQQRKSAAGGGRPRGGGGRRP